MNTATTLLLASVCFGALGCNSAPEELPSPPVSNSSLTPRSVGTTVSGASLAQAYEFPLHGNPGRFEVANNIRFDGSTESILHFPNTGGVSAWSRPDAPQYLAGWPADIDSHNTQARAYLVRIGVPAAELAELHEVRGFTGGVAAGAPSSLTNTSIGYTTTFDRRVNGVRVPDSHAGVQLNALGEPVALYVVWPAAPQSALQGATALMAKFSGDWRLPAQIQGNFKHVAAEVVLRHSPAGDADLTWTPCIRTTLAGKRTTIIDTDFDGNLLTTYEPAVPGFSTAK